EALASARRAALARRKHLREETVAIGLQGAAQTVEPRIIARVLFRMFDRAPEQCPARRHQGGCSADGFGTAEEVLLTRTIDGIPEPRLETTKHRLRRDHAGDQLVAPLIERAAR